MYFKGPDGTLYRQKDGVAMGSPLGPLFANFYMCHIENQILQQEDVRPCLYVRYVDDILLCVRDENHLKALKTLFEDQSVLKFTYELSDHNKIAFLDIWIEAEGRKWVTLVYRKPTDEGNCLNAKSECPGRYKSSVIRSFVRRAFTHCSTWEKVNVELTRIRQVLINNGYSNRQVDAEIKDQMDKQRDKKTPDEKDKINIYYRGQMNSSYNLEERIIRDIITSHVECSDPKNQLSLIIYYNTNKTSGLVLQNNMHAIRQRKNKTATYNAPTSFIGITAPRPVADASTPTNTSARPPPLSQGGSLCTCKREPSKTMSMSTTSDTSPDKTWSKTLTSSKHATITEESGWQRLSTSGSSHRSSTNKPILQSRSHCGTKCAIIIMYVIIHVRLHVLAAFNL